MKKVITLSAILALTLATVAEAKGGRSSSFRSSPSRAVATQPMTQKTMNNTQQKRDATFDNTPNRAIPNQQAQAANGNRMASFATGAAAGYLLSNALAPSEAVANEQAPATNAEPMAQQAVENPQQVANAQGVANVAAFRSIGGQIDPFLVEKTDGYRRYCISGVQYLAAAQGGQSAPIVMVTPNGSPLTCQLVP